jgi:alkylhydroperoxidase family enzyme
MSFLNEPSETDETKRLYDADLESDGYVGNLTRIWSWRPDVSESFAALRRLLTSESTLALEDYAILVAATASTLGDSYCSLAWGTRLATLAGEQIAAEVLRGGSAELTDRQRALAEWARQVVRDPNATTQSGVEALKEVGLDDRSIFEATTFIALRLAFSTVNDALGAAPDTQLERAAPHAVRQAVMFGRTAG